LWQVGIDTIAIGAFVLFALIDGMNAGYVYLCAWTWRGALGCL